MLRFLLFTFVAAASAGVIHEGACPEMKPVQNFNLTAYSGLWYEISKYPTTFEEGGKCASAEYTLQDGGLKIKNAHVINGSQIFIEGSAKPAADAKNAGSLVVTFEIGGVSRSSPLLVLATDYTNYAIAYNCKYDESKKSHDTSAWVLSRSKKLEGAAKTAVDEFFKANSKELEVSKLVTTDFSEEACKFKSTVQNG